MWNGTTIKVSLAGNLSAPIHQRKGVPQGDKLSPLVIAFYIADLPKVISKTGVKCIFYADDLAIIAKNATDLNKALEALRKYCLENDLRVNVPKTKSLKCFRGRSRSEESIVYGDTEIENVKELEYLGIIITPRQAADQSFRASIQKSGWKHYGSDIQAHVPENQFRVSAEAVHDGSHPLRQLRN